MIYFALNSMALLLLKHLFFFHHNADYCNLIYRTVFKIGTILKKPKTTRDRQKHTHPDVSLLITERKKKPNYLTIYFVLQKSWISLNFMINRRSDPAQDLDT